MYSIRMAKYTSADVEAVAARNVLLQTGSAELWHVRVRQSQIRDGGLEDIRRQLQAHPMLFGSTR